MFSFHKPKIYRSISGCCICKAKSSSSRFTDSKKYEAEFERCFRIQEKRSGEICNACVLLVKRWKKLSPENRCIKNWHHVVDARAGPGTKSYLSKQQQNQRMQNGEQSSSNSISRENRSSNSSRQIKQGNKVAYLSASKFEINHREHDDEDDEEDNGGNYLKMNISKGLPGRKKSSTLNQQLLTANDNNTSKYNDIILNRHKRPASTNLDVYSALVMTNTSQLDNLDDDEDDLDNISRNKKHKRKPLFSCRYRSGGGDNSSLEEHQKVVQQRQQLRFSSRMAKKASSSYSTSWSTSSKIANNSETASHQFRPTESICSDNVSSKIMRSRKKSCDSSKIASLLDMTLWKKEKICCGIIFRGLHDEVAIFPKLLRPCSCRLKEMMSSSERTTTKGASSKSAGESSISSSSLSDSISNTSSNDETSPNISLPMNTSITNPIDGLNNHASSNMIGSQQQPSIINNNTYSDAISTTSSSNSLLLVEDSDNSNSDSISSQSIGSTSNSVGSNLSVTNANGGVNNNTSSSNVDVAAH